MLREFRLRLATGVFEAPYRDLTLLAAGKGIAEAWALRAEREFGLRILWLAEVL